MLLQSKDGSKNTLSLYIVFTRDTEASRQSDEENYDV